jgi:RNA polymerase sigma factor (sigma-70 family)
MLRVLRGLPVFNGRYQLQAWIARIATNVSVDMVRARARRPVVDSSRVVEEDHHDPDPSPELAYERLVEHDLVISVLSTLPETHRTALVLRELEGRSHREIAKTLELTPSQAKALIHRAKSSFRRGWLRAMADRGGVAGVALLPLAWLLRGFEGARKVVDRVGGHVTQVAQAATPEVVSSSAASPAAAVVTSVSERVVAASMAVLLAGGVTVGAATLATHNRSDREKASQASTVAAPPVQAPETAPVAPPVRPVRQVRPKHHHKVVPVIPAEEVPATTDDQTSEGDTTVPVVPADPSPTPDSNVPPPPPPAPAWGFAFRFLGPIQTEPCSTCDIAPTLESSNLEGKLGGDVSFSQVMKGAVTDAQGESAWPFYLEQSGTVDPSSGQLDYKFVVSSADGPLWYEGSAFLASSTLSKNGSMTYRFVGGYSLRADQEPSMTAPVQGRLVSTIEVWSDGTIYSGSFTLLEASAV